MEVSEAVSSVAKVGLRLGGNEIELFVSCFAALPPTTRGLPGVVNVLFFGDGGKSLL